MTPLGAASSLHPAAGNNHSPAMKPRHLEGEPGLRDLVDTEAVIATPLKPQGAMGVVMRHND
jgi:hypothetical protein